MSIPTFLATLALGTLLLIICAPHTAARPYKDSPIQRIIVPYQRKVVSGHPYQYPNAVHETRQVLVPQKMDMIPNFNLHHDVITMNPGGEHAGVNGMPVNFVDGAYPVYYMPGNVNGKFNGKISLLTPKLI